jgi:hypothetical protein
MVATSKKIYINFLYLLLHCAVTTYSGSLMMMISLLYLLGSDLVYFPVFGWIDGHRCDFDR